MTYIPSNSQFARNSQFSEYIWTYRKLTGSLHFCYIIPTPPPPRGEDNGFWVKQCLIGHPPFYKHQCHFTDVHNPSPDESNGPVLISVRKPIAWCLTCFSGNPRSYKNPKLHAYPMLSVYRSWVCTHDDDHDGVAQSGGRSAVNRLKDIYSLGL